MLHPEFGASLPVEIAEAHLDRYRSDAAVSGYYKTIEPAEAEDLILDKSWPVPAVFVVIFAEDEERSGGSNQGDLTTVIDTVIFDPAVAVESARRYFRSRVTSHFKRLLLTDQLAAGVLTNAAGEPLTDYLERFERVPGPRYVAAHGYLITNLRAIWKSKIDLLQRTYV